MGGRSLQEEGSLRGAGSACGREIEGPGHAEQYYPGLTSGIPGSITHALVVVWGLQ